MGSETDAVMLRFLHFCDFDVEDAFAYLRQEKSRVLLCFQNPIIYDKAVYDFLVKILEKNPLVEIGISFFLLFFLFFLGNENFL